MKGGQGGGGEGRGYRKERREGSGGHMEWWLRGPVGLHVGLVCVRYFRNDLPSVYSASSNVLVR